MLDSYKISKSHRLDDPYVCAGDRIYLVGTQDGLFPDMGGHVPEEMGGLWDHPIKLADGFWAVIKEGEYQRFLKKASMYITGPFYQEFVYNLKGNDLIVKRKQFCPDGIEGIVINYEIKNITNNDKKITFELLLRTDLRPVWLAEKLNIFDGDDLLEYREDVGVFIGRDEKNPWYIVWGSDKKADDWEIPDKLGYIENTNGNGANGKLIYKNIEIKGKSTYSINFFISGSYVSEQKALKDFNFIKDNHDKLFEEKSNRYMELIKSGNIRVPDERINQAIDWVKFNYDWLIRDVPDIGRGLGAGIPEYPWWFGCDNGYALLGLLPTGRFDEIEDTLRLLKNVSEKENGNGRIIHEVSTNGVVFNKGNTQETAQFIKLVWQVFQWTGNVNFLKEMFPFIEKSINWLLNDMDKDDDLLPEGYGIIEIEGLNCENIDTAVFTQRALEAYAEMLDYLKIEGSEIWREKAGLLKDKINTDFWKEEDNTFADFMAKPEEFIDRYDIFKNRGFYSNDDEFINIIEKLKGEAIDAEPGRDKSFNEKLGY
ncbi:hypothetical protein SAMN02746089_01521 [Caldanaerobius fijiensis DSM 17918]|uniref:Uncharacterized protein n=1 Tax=Caldanaerobius fijiensis DSM 17918 TaxID=1121256 RepID=A0A1M4ZYL5_9THEO|nr:hypothetical protein [Caldanaerobius fijiensis]SHF23085.1 hypothetical protein SAMN02746089_01521 [Caldanaerobius fijiensis DSM 17918]